jgi:hypothetical protein
VFLATIGENRAGELTGVKNRQIAAQQFEYKSQIRVKAIYISLLLIRSI